MQRPGVIIEAATEATVADWSFSDVNRQPVAVTVINPKKALLDAPGRTWVTVLAIDYAAQVHEIEQIVIDIPAAAAATLASAKKK